MTGSVSQLFFYPVKGLSAQPMAHVTLTPGKGFPLDRAFGLARPDSGFDPANPRPLPKGKFVVLARDAALATLDTHYDPGTQVLKIAKGGEKRTFDLNTEAGRAGAAEMISDHIGMPVAARPTLQSAAPHRFTDVSVVSPAMMEAVSVISTESVQALAEKIGQPVDPARFRGNIVVSGVPAFQELDWVGREIRIGELSLKGVLRTKRCPATEVNLETGVRDLEIPALIRRHFGHSDMGVYCEVTGAGQIRPGDRIEVL